MFSCRTRGFCPSCHAKRIEECIARSSSPSPRCCGSSSSLSAGCWGTSDHPHIHFLATEGGVDAAGVFHKIPRSDDSRLAEIFAREVLSFLVGRELLSPEWAERLLSWPHTGFNVHGGRGPGPCPGDPFPPHLPVDIITDKW